MDIKIKPKKYIPDIVYHVRKVYSKNNFYPVGEFRSHAYALRLKQKLMQCRNRNYNVEIIHEIRLNINVTGRLGNDEKEAKL